jgi:stalled ribosome alternative rescue factor ArfA
MAEKGRIQRKKGKGPYRRENERINPYDVATEGKIKI